MPGARRCIPYAAGPTRVRGYRGLVMPRGASDPGAVAHLRSALAAALDGGAPVVLGDPPSLPVPDGVALVLRTSGSSSGVGQPVALSAAALTASADATHVRLGGPGRWVLALPPRHVAGVQVLVRSLRAGVEPLLVAGAFDPGRLAGALRAAPDDAPLYLSLVPTQLHRVLGDAAATAALARCRAVLLGGAAAPASLLARARDAGVPVVTTYGMTETSGGCVYDGRPLDGVGVRLDDGGRVQIGGPVLAEGYLDDGPQPFAEDAGVRWFTTSDVGEIDREGRLQVLGRADDVITSGGVKVHPAHVERQLEPVLGEALVVGVPDDEWGSLVTAVVTRPTTLRQLRDAVGGGPAAPRAVVLVEQIPTLGPGKPDRRAAAALAAAALAAGAGERY